MYMGLSGPLIRIEWCCDKEKTSGCQAVQIQRGAWRNGLRFFMGGLFLREVILRLATGNNEREVYHEDGCDADHFGRLVA